MKKAKQRRKPGEVRDAIVNTLSRLGNSATVADIEQGVRALIGEAPSSSVRSYLRLNRESLFEQPQRGVYSLREPEPPPHIVSRQIRSTGPAFSYGKSRLIHQDCFDWLSVQPRSSIHAVVTDPPYGLLEYEPLQQQKLRDGKGGVWRIPPSFDGTKRSPLPRFTVLSSTDLAQLSKFFFDFARLLLPVLVPGANVIVASNPLLSYLVSSSLARAGLERRGEIVRLVMTMRGGDRPKAAHEEFQEVSVMPRSMWEPWLLFRRPLEGRVQDNLRKWKTGGFRRPTQQRPFGDVIASAPTHKSERAVAPHPSLKPQAFLRTLIRGVLPLGEGTILDPFAGSGSTLAAAEATGYECIGLEKDRHYFDMATAAIPKLAELRNGRNYAVSL